MLPQDQLYQLIKKSMWVRRTLHNCVSFVEGLILSGYKDATTLQLIQQVNRECEMWVTTAEAATLFALAKRQQQVPGVMAEVGVYQGGTAKLICEAKGATPLHLFDTFAGIPTTSAEDAGYFAPQTFQADLARVTTYLAPYANISLHPGLFPKTGHVVAEARFSFVFLDVDTYQSTKDSLLFFYERLSPGGILLSHDYQYPGVRQAFKDTGLQAHSIELGNSLVMLIKA